MEGPLDGCATDGDGWKLLRTCDFYLGLLLKDALRCNAHVVVVGQRFGNQLL